MTSALAQVSPELLALMAGRMSVLVASRDAHLRPSVMRAMGCAIDAAAGEVTVFLARAQAAQLLRDLETAGGIAVMFSQPTTHRTVQLKAASVRLRPADAGDAPVLRDYADSLSGEIEQVGYPRPLARTMLAHRLDELVGVSFAPTQVFEQTPGAKAGALVAAVR